MNGGNGIPPIQELFKWVIVVVIIVMMYKFVEKDILIYQINQNLPPEEAAVVVGMVLGDKSGFEKEKYNKFVDTGLVHLVVASGTNVMLLIGGLVGGLAWVLGRKKTIVLALVLAWGYAGMTGWQPPIVRAVLMASILYWAQMLGRKFNVVRGLGLAAIIMIAGEPEVLVSYSFWLSMAAFIGLIIGQNKGHLGQILWINIMVAPILWLMTGRINLMSLVANMLVVGMTEIITAVVAVTLIWGGGGMLVVYPMVRWVNLVSELL